MNYFYPPTKSLTSFLSEENVKQFFLSRLSLAILLLFLLAGTPTDLRGENDRSASCDEPTITCPADNYGLEDGCNVEAPEAATEFNDEDDQNPDPSLPTVEDGCGDLELTHEDLHSESDCIHVLKRIYTVTDDEDDYASCTQIFTWRVDEEGPTFNDPPADITLECDEVVPDAPVLVAVDNCVPPDILFINEIHYDNEDTDVNEFIEIAGQAGIDLSEYELYAYEEHDGMYDDHVVLSGIIPDEGDGWGAVAFDKDFLGSKFFENGKSGLAIIKIADDFVTEFISYEGYVTATNGPAEGCTSKLIGVEEGATPEDESIQRVGTACEACDFGWIEPDEGNPGAALATPGYINANQTFDDDQCPDLPIEYDFEETITPGPCDQEYIITRTWTATDVCENTGTHVQTITIDDSTPPSITCPAGFTVECIEDVPACNPNDATASDNCGTVTITCSQGQLVGGGCGGTVTNTYTATDECGNSSSCTQVITVDDTTPPVAPAPPADVNVQCASDVPPPVNLTAIDNCDGEITVSPSAVITPGNCDDQFVMVRTWTFVDNCDNSSSVSQTITVHDDTAPIFTSVPDSEVVECEDDILLGNATAQDNCSNTTITTADMTGTTVLGMLSGDQEVPPSGSDATGEIIGGYDSATGDIFLYISFNGLQANATAAHIHNAPAGSNGGVIINLGPLGFPIDVTSGSFVAITTLTPGQVTELEAGNLYVNVHTSAHPGGEIRAQLNVVSCGTAMKRVFTAIDDCGNQSTAAQVIASNDTTAPVPPAPPADVAVQCAEDVPPPVDLTAIDNCDGEITVSPTAVITPGTCVDDFIMVRTWTFVDECGNSSSVSQTITVHDDTPPTLVCPADMTVECVEDIPACNPDDATANDNCGETFVTCEQGPLVGGPCGGTVTVTFTATDNCGNSVSCTQTITVDDTTPPTFTVPADVTIECIDDPDDLDLTGDVIDAMDNCAGESGIWINEFHYDNVGTDQGEFIEVAGTAGTNLSTYQLVLYNGANGNVYNTKNLSGTIPNESAGYGAISFSYPTNGIQNGTRDGIALVESGTVLEFISYEGVQTANNGPAAGMTSIDIGVSETSSTPVGFSLQLTGFGSTGGDFTWVDPSLDSPGSINTGQAIGVMIEYEDESDVTTCEGGTILRTWTVTDVCDNANSQVQTIIVNPPADPIITCPADVTVACIADFVVDPENAAVIIDCELSYKLWVTQPDVEGAQNCPGTTYTFTYKVLDDCDGYADCQQVVTIENDPPVVTVIPGETVLCFEDIVTSPSDATVTTSCGDDYDLKILPPVLEGVHECPGTTYTYAYRVRDNCGREVIANRVFTIGNNAPPTIVAPPDMTVECSFNANVNPNFAEVTTGCTLGYETTVTGPVVSGAEDCPGTTYTYTYTVTDDCGRTASDVRVFTILNGPPVIACPQNCLINNCEDGDYLAIIDAWLETVTATSSCGADINVNNNYNPNSLGFCIWNGYTPVTFFATDNCGRTTTCVAMIVITDTEDPIVIEPAQDMLTVCNANTQSVLDQWVDNNGGAIIEDGCWGDDISWSTSPGNPTINCMGMMGNTSIEVTFTATDGCGNSVSTTATFTALMTGNDIIIHGGIQTEEGGKLEGAEVTLDGNSAGLPATQMSNDQGAYEFGNLTLESNYVVTPAKNDDPLNGLSTYDILLMTKHVLASELLDSPYKIIAADINNSGTVSTIDILKLRRLILFIDTEFQENTSWRFVDAEFVFPDPTNPFATSFPEIYSINGLLESEIANFVAVKIGDLNGSATPNSLMSGEDRNTIGDLTFELNDQQLVEGEQYEIPFRASDFDGVLGYQFTLNFDAGVMDFIETEAGSLTKLDASNFGLRMVEEGVITTSWSDVVPTNVDTDDVLFTLRFNAKADAKLSEVLRISSQYTKSEAYNNQGLLNIGLNFNVDGKVQSNPFALYQNQPNPFKNETVIGFNMPESGKAKMKFFDVTGKLVKEIEGDYSEGYNQISVTRADLPSAGVLYYQLETESNSATKKMILMTLK